MKKIVTLLLALCLSLQIINAQTAPDFTFTDIHGDQHNLQHALNQGYIVMIDFFFVDCPPCQQSAPEIQAMHEDYAGKNVIIWSISDRDSDDYIEQYKTGAGLEYIAGGIQGGGNTVINDYASQFTFTGFPTISIVCPDGSITWDIWPYTSGAPEWRNAIDACGVVDADPYQPMNATSTADVDQAGNRLSVFPNPVQQSTLINLELQHSAQVQLKVSNLLGQPLKTVNLGKQNSGIQQFDLDIHDLPKGTYILQVNLSEETVLSKKIIKL